MRSQNNMGMRSDNCILKADILYSRDREDLAAWENAYLVCAGGVSGGVYASIEELPEEYRSFSRLDYSGQLVIPGLTDLHIHAPQYGFRGLYGDMELLEWLNRHTFPEEARYEELSYAKKAYELFVEDIRKGPTTSFCAFASIHVPATELLMELTEERGLKAYIGKVNMDRNSPEYLCETTEASFRETLKWLSEVEKRRFRHVKPILTPRFIPSCTDELMGRLGELIRETGLPLQSHLSENQSEISWVKELCTEASCYGDAYDRQGCFGGYGNKTIMAHCVWSTEEEQMQMQKNGVFIAHSPSSNTNLASGIAPVRKYLEQGLSVGLATDLSGGTSPSMFRMITDAIGVSKLYWRLMDQSKKPLTFPEAFYLATKGGGAFFGKTGGFEKGYSFDALVLSEEGLSTPLEGLSPAERLERYCYLAGERPVAHKFVCGRQLF